jgi:Flp pilus assembly protein TadG
MNSTKNERGQSLVLVALMLFVFIGMMALAIDGGFTYVSRRSAQNAADAGALAGARELCRGEEASVVQARAREYVTRNVAETVTVEIVDHSVNVTTRVNHNTFFARVLGFNEINANATASAGCFNPCTAFSVTPVAFNCRAPAGDILDPEDPEDECKLEPGDLTKPDDHPDQPLYIIMDSGKSNFVCQDPITKLPLDGINCEDTNVRLYGPGNRGWLYLSGGGGAADLYNWMKGGYQFNLVINTWFPDKSGDVDKIYKAADEIVGKVVLVPVFDGICPTYPGPIYPGATYPDFGCPDLYDPDRDQIQGEKVNDSYYHVVSFEAFKLTCVQDKIKEKKSDNCPAVQRLIDANPDVDFKDFAKDMITGFFVEDVLPEVSGACGESGPGGLSTIYLKK